MMQHRHVEVAAHHALSILRWRMSSTPLSTLELQEALDAIYQESDAGRHVSGANGSHADWKAITFSGVSIAYHHFFGRRPLIWEIRKLLNEAGDNAGWSTVDRDRARDVARQ